MSDVWIKWGAVGLVVALAGCEGELPGPDRHQGSRAVQGPGESINDPENEVMGPPNGVVPLVRVETSGKKDQPAKVQTIVSETVRMLSTRPAASQPVIEPGPSVPARGVIDTTGTTTEK